MKNTCTLLVTIFLMLSLSEGAIAKEKGGGKHYVFNLVGTATATAGMVPDPDNPGDEMSS